MHLSKLTELYLKNCSFYKCILYLRKVDLINVPPIRRAYSKSIVAKGKTDANVSCSNSRQQERDLSIPFQQVTSILQGMLQQATTSKEMT